ncbi:unnamed protein product [Camellia sinensis]
MQSGLGDQVAVGRALDLLVLHKVGVEGACATTITLDTPGANYRTVWALSKYFPNVKTFVRAHDVDHGLNLEKAKLLMSQIVATINEFRSRHLFELSTIRLLSEASGSCLDYGYSRIMSKPKSQPSDSSDDNQITEGTLVVEAAKIAAISIVDMQNVVEEDSESSKEDDMEGSAVQGEVKMRMINSIRLLWINWRRLGSTKISKGLLEKYGADRVVDNPITKAGFYGACPGLKVLAPYSSEDACGLLKATIRDPDPVVFLENELLYGESFPILAEVLDSSFCLPIGKAKVEREGKDVMITTFSRMVGYAIKAAEILAKEGISAEVINLRSIRPLDRTIINASVRNTSRLVTVEKGGKAFTAKRMQVLELVGKETMDLLIAETGWQCTYYQRKRRTIWLS